MATQHLFNAVGLKWILCQLSVGAQRAQQVLPSGLVFSAKVERSCLPLLFRQRYIDGSAVLQYGGFMGPPMGFCIQFKGLKWSARYLSTGVVAEGNGKLEEDAVPVVAEVEALPVAARVPLSARAIQQAADVGYKIVGRLNSALFGPIKRPKAFAIVQVGSHQFKVSPGDCIYTEKLKYADVNDKLCLEKVLLLGSKSQTIIGRPTVPEAVVQAVVEEHALDAKVIIFKKKRRKNYRRTKGHRQELTRLRILEIQGLAEVRPDNKAMQLIKLLA